MDAKRIKLFIFDLDGTLVDSRQDIAEAANFMRKQLGLSVFSEDKISSFIGNGIRELVKQVLEGADDATLEKGMYFFQDHYKQHCLKYTCLYPGAKEVLHQLSNNQKKLAVATNKTAGLSRIILDGLKVGSYFQIILGGDSVKKRKPDPEPLQAIMSGLGISAADTAMVGDSYVDIEAGKRARVGITCGLTCGIGDLEKLKATAPDYLVNSFKEFESIFL